MEKVDTNPLLYRIECTGEAARVIQDALELWARCSIGQFKEALEPCRPHGKDFPLTLYGELRQLAETMERFWRTSTAPTGIRAAKGDHAWEIHQTIRHRLSWDSVGNPPQRIWSGDDAMWGVNFDEPMAISGKPFIKIEQITTKPVRFGCHCDLEPDMQPDGCVLDYGKPQDCIHSDCGDKSKCPYWHEIKED